MYSKEHEKHMFENNQKYIVKDVLRKYIIENG